MSSVRKLEQATAFIRDGRWRGGLRWFLAEFLVVVVGVLVALAVSAWWQGRLDREHERRHLQQLAADLRATEADMQQAHTTLTHGALAAMAVEHAFWGERPTTESDFRRDLIAPWGSARFRPVLGNIEALISTGDINVIRAADLRAELVSYDEWVKARLEDINRYDETYYRPGVNALLARLDPAGAAIDLFRKSRTGRAHAFDLWPFSANGDPPFPVDLASLLKDRIAYNAYGQIGLAHRNEAGAYGSILERARYLHARVYRELHGVTEPGNCQLRRQADSDAFAGSCGGIFGADFGFDGDVQLRLHPVKAITSGRWKAGDEPADAWAGEMVVPGFGKTDIELQDSIFNDGMLRTQLGWFPVQAVGEDDTIRKDFSRLSFRVDTAHEVPPDSLDIAILRKAKALLADASDWDRQDDRQCTPDKPRLSLYCGLRKATILESGGFHHRRPAMQIVRQLVDDRSAGRDYQHRLRDYNNDPRTTLAEVQALFDQAIAKAQAGQSKDAGS